MADVHVDLDPQLLRSFVAVAEELHFSRAAARLYLTQQAVSRHVRRLEDDLGVLLFGRTTRSVELTAAGRRLLPAARHLLHVNDQVVAQARGARRPLLVDAVAEGSTPTLLLRHARDAQPAVEFRARFSGGVGAAMAQLMARRVDVAFGRCEGIRPPFDDHLLARRLVRLEPLGLLVADDGPLAARSAISAEALAGTEIDVSAGNPLAPEWTDLAEQFLRLIGADPSPPHEHAVGPAETAQHLRTHGRPILVMTQSLGIPGAVMRPVVDPVPLYPWALIHPKDLDHPGVGLLHDACDHALTDWGWLDRPAASWIPPSDAAAFGL